MTAATTTAAARPNAFKRLYLWVLHWADTKYGTPALAAISFAESSFFPIPPDVLQIALSVAKPKRAFYYAAVSAAASVVGGVVGWMIGSFFWHLVADAMFVYVPGFERETFEHVRQLFLGSAFLAILTAAFTPIPYKIFTIASGVFGVPLPTLVVASAIGRSGRFFLVGAAIYVFGPTIRGFLDRYLEWITIGLLVLLVGGFYAVRYLF